MFHTFAVCLLVLLISISAYSNRESGKGDMCGEEVSGLRSCIWLDSQTFGSKQKILVHYRIQNVSGSEIALWQSGFWPNNKIVALDDHGASVKLTREGRQKLAAFSPGGERTKNFLMRLKSNESFDVTTLDLRKLFVFESPGNYTVRFLYEEYQDGGWQGKLTSNELRFRIE